ncbi:hypothetical protein [Metapseudomonas sp. CR1201]
MAELKLFKVVASLPASLEPDALYLVRAGAGFDLYATNHAGTVVSYPLNLPDLSTKQDAHANLSALSGVTGSAGAVFYFTAAGAGALAASSSFGRSLWAHTNLPSFRLATAAPLYLSNYRVLDEFKHSYQQVATVTGCLKITLPALPVGQTKNTMLGLRLRLYEYTGRGLCYVECGGYMMEASDVKTWYQTSKKVTSMVTPGSMKEVTEVKFGVEAGRYVILLGKTAIMTDSTWAYPSVAVEKVVAQFSGATDEALWNDPAQWAIEYVADISGVTIIEGSVPTLNDWHSGNFDPATKANLASPTFSGTVTLPTTSVTGTMTLSGNLILRNASAGSIATAPSSAAGLEARGDADDAAFIAFHRAGVYAAYLGLDTDNRLKYGGWSAGASAYEIWHAANTPKQANASDTTLGAMLVNGSHGIGIGLIATDPELDNYLTPGKYLTPTSGLTPLPAGFSMTRQTLEVIGYEASSYITQMLATVGADSITTPRVAVRSKKGPVQGWTNWGELWHSANFDPNSKASLSGATFTGGVVANYLRSQGSSEGLRLTAPAAANAAYATIYDNTNVRIGFVGKGNAGSDNMYLAADIGEVVLTRAGLTVLTTDAAGCTLGGVPKANTAAAGTNTTQLATTAFVQDARTKDVEATASTAYTLVLADQNKHKRMTGTSAVTVTIPPNSSVAFPVSTEVDIERYTVSTVTIAAGAGVTIRTPDDLTIPLRWQVVTLKKVSTDEWILIR